MIGRYRDLPSHLEARETVDWVGIPDGLAKTQELLIIELTKSEKISIMVPSQDFHAAFIELKQVTGKPSDLSEYQREWIRNLNDMGYKAVVCFGAKEALDFTRNYLGWAE